MSTTKLASKQTTMHTFTQYHTAVLQMVMNNQNEPNELRCYRIVISNRQRNVPLLITVWAFPINNPVCMNCSLHPTWHR